MGKERDDVVLDLALDLLDARDVELGILAFGPDLLSRGLGNDPKFGHGVGRVRLDLEPDAVARLRIPDRGHLRPSVTRDHGRPRRVIDGAVADRRSKLNSLARSVQYRPANCRSAAVFAILSFAHSQGASAVSLRQIRIAAPAASYLDLRSCSFRECNNVFLNLPIASCVCA